MKLGTICYLPPPGIGFPKTMLANLLSFKHKYPILFYSDEPKHYMECHVVTIKSPTVKLATLPWWKIATNVFCEGVRLAKGRFDYFIEIESDCRFGCDNWDEAIFDEFFSSKQSLIVGGTFFAHHLYNEDMAWVNAYEEWRRDYPHYPNHPSVLLYGKLDAVTRGPVQVWPNGALSVCQTEAMSQYFPIPNKHATAWDCAIGKCLREQYGLNMFRYMRPMTKTFSYYGDLLFTEEQRMTLLKEGGCVAVHAIKSNI